MTALKGVAKEILNIILMPRHYTVFIGLVQAIIAVLFRRFYGRLKHFHLRYYPEKVRIVSDTINNSVNLDVNYFENDHQDGPTRLKLAIGFMELKNTPDWHQTFEEQEQFFSLHRWGWLLYSLTSAPADTSSEWGESLMRSWLKEMTPLPKGSASESYSVGERISNACLFFRHVKGVWSEVPPDLLSALHIMGLSLSQRIEYYADDLSGNHVINNSRAILFVGHCCNDANLILLGRTVLEEQVPKLIDDGGFLREGSSHYQFLFTRWILEIRMLSLETKDVETLAVVNSVIPKLLSACNLLLVRRKNGYAFFPCIGDISPDCEPEWLFDMLRSPLAGFPTGVFDCQMAITGWAALFPDSTGEVSINDKSSDNDPMSWQSCKYSSWHRLDFEDWTAIWHMESSSGPAIASHAHHDIGALVLFLNGEEIMIDSGRYDYSQGLLGQYGLDACAHNTIQLDGFPPMLSKGDRILPESYRDANCSILFNELSNGIQIKIKHNGFSRISKQPILHTRAFLFTKAYCEITDYLDGDGKHFFESFFQWPVSKENAKNCPRSNNGMPLSLYSDLGVDMELLTHNKINVDFRVASEDPIRGWRFLSYGRKSPSATQRFYGHIELPLKLSYRLSKE